MTNPAYDDLVEAAKAARENAYAPYSGYHVGAALLTSAGEVYTGTNVENASYGLTICAERVAIAYAVAQGERDFVAIAIVTESDPPATPCGACRQVLAEFGPALDIICASTHGTRTAHTIASLLPESFTKRTLDGTR